MTHDPNGDQPPSWLKRYQFCVNVLLVGLVMAALARYLYVVYERTQQTQQLMQNVRAVVDHWKTALTEKNVQTLHDLCSFNLRQELTPVAWSKLLQKHPVLSEKLIMQSFTCRSDGVYLWKQFLGIRDETCLPFISYVYYSANDPQHRVPVTFVFILDGQEIKVREVAIAGEPLKPD